MTFVASVRLFCPVNHKITRVATLCISRFRTLASSSPVAVALLEFFDVFTRPDGGFHLFQHPIANGFGARPSIGGGGGLEVKDASVVTGDAMPLARRSGMLSAVNKPVVLGGDDVRGGNSKKFAL
jgi:hypothetical protein